MNPVLLSSGDLVADRRADYAEMLFESGDRKAAAELYRDTLDLVPGWTAGWFRYGEMAEAAGERRWAVDAWRKAVDLDPEDHLGASLRLTLAGADGVEDTMPPAFVEMLFDQYAPDFDEALVEKLHYRAPQLIGSALEQAGAGSFAHVLDLGCGTGLMGEVLRSRATRLEGWDISREMLRHAEGKAIYDALDHRDLNQLEPLNGARPDLMVAADVFMYLGGLDHLFAWIAANLASGGHFAFSVELLDCADDLELRPSRRFAHSAAYVNRVLGEHGLAGKHMLFDTIRTDRGKPIAGLIVVAAKS